MRFVAAEKTCSEFLLKEEKNISVYREKLARRHSLFHTGAVTTYIWPQNPNTELLDFPRFIEFRGAELFFVHLLSWYLRKMIQHWRYFSILCILCKRQVYYYREDIGGHLSFLMNFFALNCFTFLWLVDYNIMTKLTLSSSGN